MDLKGRNFLTLKDFTPEEITYMIDLAAGTFALEMLDRTLQCQTKKHDHYKYNNNVNHYSSPLLNASSRFFSLFFFIQRYP